MKKPDLRNCDELIFLKHILRSRPHIPTSDNIHCWRNYVAGYYGHTLRSKSLCSYSYHTTAVYLDGISMGILSTTVYYLSLPCRSPRHACTTSSTSYKGILGNCSSVLYHEYLIRHHGISVYALGKNKPNYVYDFPRCIRLIWGKLQLRI